MGFANTYKGKYSPRFPDKYIGDRSNIVWRSSWELMTFKYADMNPDIVKWSSELFVIPYKCKTDGQMHRYFVDLYFEFKSGKKFLIEIKPAAQTRPPKVSNTRNKRVLMEEVLTWAKNESKWTAARAYASKKDMQFFVWTEETLRALGINVSTGFIPKAKLRV